MKKKYSSWLQLSVAAILCCCMTVFSQTTHFSVDGYKIFDPDGKRFIIRGCNVQGQEHFWPRNVMQDTTEILCWNFNLLRVNCLLFRDGFDDNNDIHAYVDFFTPRKIVVMFEVHDFIGGYLDGNNLTAAVNWFKELAVRYKDNPYVWYEVHNEPGRTTPDRSRWVNQHQAVIKAIRDEVGNGAPILCNGTSWGQDAGGYSSRVNDGGSAVLSYGHELINFNGKTYTNIIFGYHGYDQWTNSVAKMEDYVKRAYDKGYALICGEFGIHNNGDIGKIPTRGVMSVHEKFDVGFAAWSWHGGDNNRFCNPTMEQMAKDTKSGMIIDNCQNPTNLSWLGSQIWQATHRHVTNADETDFRPVRSIKRRSEIIRSNNHLTVRIPHHLHSSTIGMYNPLGQTVFRTERLPGDKSVSTPVNRNGIVILSINEKNRHTCTVVPNVR
jgi:mannan endo-1,4-beta-mannosidase